MAAPDASKNRPPAFDPRPPVRAAVAGAIAGLVGGAYRLVLGPDAPWSSERIVRLAHGPVDWVGVAGLFAAGAALSRWLTVRFAPEASGSGIPQVEESLAGNMSLRWRRLLPVKFVGGALALVSGLSLGREGPTVHLGAGIASALEGPLDASARRAMLAAGAAAGLTAAFSAPIASFIFVLEELRLRPSRLVVSTVLPAVLASYLVVQRLVGPGPMFEVPPVPTPSAALTPLFLALGLAAGMVGVVFNRGLLRSLDLFATMPRRLPWLGAAAVGALAAVVAYWLPEAIDGGEHAVEALIQGRMSPALVGLTVFLVVKLGLTLASYGCGVPGGIFAPQLALGAAVGAIVHTLAPDLGGGTLGPVLATAGMVGVFAASVRAPMTGLVLLVELTHSGRFLIPQATAALAAYLFAAAVRDRPVYEALRERDERHDRA
jgi:chloride channel protein, CIC family